MIGDGECQTECHVKKCEWDRDDCLIANGRTPKSELKKVQYVIKIHEI